MKKMIEEIREEALKAQAEENFEKFDELVQKFLRFQETAKLRFLEELEEGNIFTASEYIV